MSELLDDNNDGIAITGASDTLPREFLDKAPTIESLRTRFDEARGGTNQEGRVRSQTDRDYYDGPKQLNSDVRRLLSTRNQPPIYTNRVRPAINGILGVLEMSRSDPKGLPRNPDDEKAAPVGTKTLRYIADYCHFQETRQEVAENFFIEGTGACIVELDDDRKVVATQIRWEEFYHDPYSRRNDLHDARYMGVAKWKDWAEVQQRWRERVNEIGDPLVGGRLWGLLGTGYEDRPEGLGWIDRKRRRVLLVEEYHIRDGMWMRCIYIATGILEYGPSPWLDDKGRPCNPIEAVSCYVAGGTSGQSQGMEPNSRYGIVRDMVPVQDEINAGRSRALHLSNSRQLQKVDFTAPPVDAQTAKAEASKPDGLIPDGYQVVPTGEQTNAALLRMQEAKGEIERMSPTPLARDLGGGTAVSGRARLVAQQAGQAEIARPLARLKDWRLRVYRQFWNRARQFWTDPMWIRVTDELRTPEFLQLNEPVLGLVMQPVAGPDGQPVLDPMTGQPAMQPGIGVVEVKNRPAEIGMDIILDEDPDTATLQEEIFAELMELIKSGVPLFSKEFEILIEMSPLSDKARVLERLKAHRDEMQQQQGEGQQKQAQLAEAGAVAELAKTAAETEKLQAQTQQIETDMLATGFKAGFDSVPEQQPLPPPDG